MAKACDGSRVDRDLAGRNWENADIFGRLARFRVVSRDCESKSCFLLFGVGHFGVGMRTATVTAQRGRILVGKTRQRHE